MGIFNPISNMQDFNILELIPQRPPFVMVDKLLQCDELKSVSCFNVAAENVLSDGKVFSEAGLTENIAQTAAARIGYLIKSQGKKPQIGYIGAIKNLKIHFCPPVPSLLVTEIVIISEIMGFTIIKGTVMAEGKEAAECEMRIFLLH